MTASPLGETLVIATHNPGKLREIAELIEPFGLPYGLNVVSAGDLGLPEPEETGATFAENAALKARAAVQGSGRPALADDSGLAVEALGGEPGIYSARWAGVEKDFAIAMARVERELEKTGSENRRAAFVCALCLAYPDGREQVFEGRIEGRLVWPPRGGKGFGYDPLFLAEGYEITFGEMEPAEKHKISHRARAFAKLVRDVFGSTP